MFKLCLLLGFYFTLSVEGVDPSTWINNYPFMASIEKDGEHICGAVVIEENAVLTSASCVRNKSATDLSIRAGTLKRGTNGQVRQVNEIKAHPEYNPNKNKYDNDLAVLKLAEKFTLDHSTLDTVEIIPSDVNLVGETGFIAGWGNDGRGDGLTYSLLYGTIPILPNEDCAAEVEITKRMICSKHAHQNPCDGDLGGPLMVNDKLAGIIAREDICGTTASMIFTRVSYFKTWIKQATL